MRGRVRAEAVRGAYTEVEDISRRLVRAVAADLWCVTEEGGMLEDWRVKRKSLVVQDIFNNMIAMK